MAKEFDAYLKSRLMERDVAVSSIPYRDGIDIVSGLLLEGVVEDLALQKYLAIANIAKSSFHLLRATLSTRLRHSRYS